MSYQSLTDTFFHAFHADFAALNLLRADMVTVDTKALSGNRRFINQAMVLLSFDLRTSGWRINTVAQAMMETWEFQSFGSLVSVTEGQLPEWAVRGVERLTGISMVIARGLRAAGNPVGYLILFYRDPSKVNSDLEKLNSMASWVEQILPSYATDEANDGDADQDHPSRPGPQRDWKHLIPDVYLGLERDLRVVFANHGISVFQKSREDAIGRAIEEVIPTAEPGRLRRLLQQFLTDNDGC